MIEFKEGFLEKSLVSVHWAYHGIDKMYHVMVDSEDVFRTDSKFERDLFIAKLKILYD